METKIREVLHSLSISGNYKGYFITILACKLIIEDEARLYNIIKEVYLVVSQKINCNLDSVERNIRTIIYRAWTLQRERLNEIAGYDLLEPPIVSEFLAFLSSYVMRMYALEESKNTQNYSTMA